MKRPVTYWYTKDQPIFENTDDFQSVIDVTRIPAGSDTPPCLKISHNTFETMEKANWEFLRLSLPVICLPTFIEFVISLNCTKSINIEIFFLWRIDGVILFYYKYNYNFMKYFLYCFKISVFKVFR